MARAKKLAAEKTAAKETVVKEVKAVEAARKPEAEMAAAEAAAIKAEPAEKTAVKKAKTAAKTVAKKAEAVKKTVKKSVKKSEPKTAVTVEFMGHSVLVKDIIASATKAYKKANRGTDIKNIEIYIKPEENAAYYVVNGDASPEYKVEL